MEWMSPRRLVGLRARGVFSAEELRVSGQSRPCRGGDSSTHGGKKRGSLEAVLRGAPLTLVSARPLAGLRPLASGDVALPKGKGETGAARTTGQRLATKHAVVALTVVGTDLLPQRASSRRGSIGRPTSPATAASHRRIGGGVVGELERAAAGGPEEAASPLRSGVLVGRSETAARVARHGLIAVHAGASVGDSSTREVVEVEVEVEVGMRVGRGGSLNRAGPNFKSARRDASHLLRATGPEHSKVTHGPDSSDHDHPSIFRFRAWPISISLLDTFRAPPARLGLLLKGSGQRQRRRVALDACPAPWSTDLVNTQFMAVHRPLGALRRPIPRRRCHRSAQKTGPSSIR